MGFMEKIDKIDWKIRYAGGFILFAIVGYILYFVCGALEAYFEAHPPPVWLVFSLALAFCVMVIYWLYGDLLDK